MCFASTIIESITTFLHLLHPSLSLIFFLTSVYKRKITFKLTDHFDTNDMQPFDTLIMYRKTLKESQGKQKIQISGCFLYFPITLGYFFFFSLAKRWDFSSLYPYQLWSNLSFLFSRIRWVFTDTMVKLQWIYFNYFLSADFNIYFKNTFKNEILRILKE